MKAQNPIMNESKVNLDVENEIRITREYDAPRELVWKALTDPAHVEGWWGPDGFTNTTEKIDVRPGGSWVFTMHGPDGKDYPNAIRYREVVAPERLAFRHGESEAENPDADFGNVITLEDLGGRTRLTMTLTLKDKATRDFLIREVKAVEGGKQTLQKLAEHLERMADTD
jgi:uncharacterized protein YndB with AHSA1/START domain